MTNINKIEIINKLSEDEFFCMFETLVKNQNFDNVTRYNNCIVGEQKIMGRKTVCLFALFPQKLSGITNEEVEIVYKGIESLQNKYSANLVFVVSLQTISNGFKNTLMKKSTNISPTYIERNELISLIDEYYSDFWRHEDQDLLAYEKTLLNFIQEDTELRKLNFSQDKYKQKLNFFIEPQLSRCYEDKKTKTIVRSKYKIDDIIKQKQSLIIQGEAGCGKSTLLKRIIKHLIDENSALKEKKNLPIYLSSQDIISSIEDIKFLIQDKLKIILGEAPLNEIKDKYYIHLLIDSIDELEDFHSVIFEQLEKLKEKYNIKYYVASRNVDMLLQNVGNANVEIYDIRRFNFEQIKHFLNAFFSGEEIKASNLLEALRENKIIDKLPLTPLNLSLISILFEEKDFEIPATISDIYDNFNSLIIGRAVVSSRVEFVDISFKERILSIYALELLNTANHQPMEKRDFEKFFINYFANKSIPIKKGTLNDALDYIVKNTGILFIKDGKYVQFTHASYMEYYASVEIFKFHREHEALYVDKFYDSNWQNSAIFYAGKSKDMPNFLQDILKKVQTSCNIYEYMSGILGCGYLIQALYLTDNKIRKDVVIEALRLSLLSLEAFKVLAIENKFLYRDYNLPLVQIINFIYFYETFNSITLKEPMKMAFDELYAKYEDLLAINDDQLANQINAIGYNLLELAFTLDSKRIGDQHGLEKVIDSDYILKNPNLLLLADFSMMLLGKVKYESFRNALKKNISTLAPALKQIIEQPIQKLRFTALDTVSIQGRIKLIVEGKTDAELLSHAYSVLTGGFMPYWTIIPGGRKSDTGSASEVKETLLHSYPLLEKNDIVIGIVDHDYAGLSAYGYLKNDFIEKEHNMWKKHKDANINIICLPIPGEMSNYLMPRFEDNYFEIEHYFGLDFLIKKKVVRETAIHNIYEVLDGRKVSFSKEMNDIDDPHIFENFLQLFQLIDKISGVNVKYIL